MLKLVQSYSSGIHEAYFFNTKQTKNNQRKKINTALMNIYFFRFIVRIKSP